MIIKFKYSQATLEANGDITFAYKAIPVPIAAISVANHRLFVGLSDSYNADASDDSDASIVATKEPCRYDVSNLMLTPSCQIYTSSDAMLLHVKSPRFARASSTTTWT